MIEVDVGQVIARLVIVFVQTKAGDRVRDNAFFGPERNCLSGGRIASFGCGSATSLGAMFGQFRAEITSVETCEPKLVRFHRRIRTANHLKFQIGNNAFERTRRMFKKKLVALSARLFAAKKSEDHGTFRRLAMGQCGGQLQHGHAAGRIIICAVIYAVTVHWLANAKVVQVGS